MPLLRFAFRSSSRRTSRRLSPHFLVFESLEERRVLDAEGTAWLQASNLTVSFAPDGTDIAGHPSQLHQQLDAIADGDAWQSAIVQALQTWMTYIQANVTVVTDDGDPFGTLGQTQGDVRFGDVRVGSIPLAGDVVAFAVPHNDAISGTWSGDILFNSHVDFSSVDELFRVALHEAGHVLGLPENNDPTSTLFALGIPTAATPTADDIAALLRLYGQPGSSADITEGDADGDIIDSATPLTSSASSLDSLRYDALGVISSATDVDFYQLASLPESLEDLQVLTVTVRSSTAPGLIPRITVLTPAGRAVEAKVLSNVNGELVVQTNDIEPTLAYVVKVQAAEPSGNFATGSYQLSARFGTQVTTMSHLTRGTLTSNSSTQVSTLHVSQTALTHLILRSADSESNSAIMVWAVISDSQGRIVARIATPTGDSRSAPSVVLSPGNYRVEVRAANLSAGRIEEVNYALDGTAVSLPIGITPTDPTGSPTVDPGTDPAATDPAATTPIIVADPAPPPDAPIDLPPLPWEDPNWWYWYIVDETTDNTPSNPVEGEAPSLNSPIIAVAKSWMNPRWAEDVDGDDSLSAIDALLIINWLNAENDSPLNTHPISAPYIDVDGDGTCAPIDVLLVINAINAGSNAPNGGLNVVDQSEETTQTPQTNPANQATNTSLDEYLLATDTFSPESKTAR